jgi:hypothetical protein
MSARADATEYNAESNAAFKAALRRIFYPQPDKNRLPLTVVPKGRRAWQGFYFGVLTGAAT